MNAPSLMKIKQVRLAPHHHASLTKHTRSDGRGGTVDFPQFVELVIAGYPGEQSSYLFHICGDGEAADTWHETQEDALYQAEWEFGVKPEEWTVPVAEPF